jgi:DNA repair protein RecN (Recombination protein N)
VIEELHIRGLGVIDDTSLVLPPGLTVVTGETGAGKTMIVTALQLLLGARASAELVRRGRDEAIIEAMVRVPQDVLAPFGAPPEPLGHDDADEGVEDAQVRDLWRLAEDGVLLVSREIPSSGRSRARVGGRLVPTSVLGALLAPHVEIHGQHEHIRLEQPAVQRRLLDAFAGVAHGEVLDAYRADHARWTAVQRRHRLLEEDAAARARRLDQLAAERDEIDRAALDLERDEMIDHDIDRLANADALRAAVIVARDAAGPSGALEGIATAMGALRRVPIDDPTLTNINERLGAVSRELSDAVADLATYASDVEADEGRLDALQSRKRELTALMRRYGASLEAVVAHRAAVAAELAELEGLEADRDGIVAALERARGAVLASGEALSASRVAAAGRLMAAVDIHLRDLGLEHAHLEVEVSGGQPPAPDGTDRVEFLLAANPGEPAARLADGASGGERSRVALALEVVLSAGDLRGVLVFDEVDAGIGGSTALAVGEKLARLAINDEGQRQVLCVTHLAQVAAFADAHHVVEKSVRDGRTVTSVRRVDTTERVEELSRMLGGEATAAAGLEHARGLLTAARERLGSAARPG